MAFAWCHVQFKYDVTMNPIITKADHNTIKSLIANLPDHLKTAEIRQLTNELNRAQVVANDKIPKDVIRLNSYFEIEEINSKQQINFTVTLPNKANIAEKRVSILSPLGIALIGFRKGMTVQWTLPGGPKKLKILKVEQAMEEAKIQTP
ncbi:MAG: GreA/GreB family elongation factor [Imperialibacter sp.]